MCEAALKEAPWSEELLSHELCEAVEGEGEEGQEDRERNGGSGGEGELPLVDRLTPTRRRAALNAGGAPGRLVSCLHDTNTPNPACRAWYLHHSLQKPGTAAVRTCSLQKPPALVVGACKGPTSSVPDAPACLGPSQGPYEGSYVGIHMPD